MKATITYLLRTNTTRFTTLLLILGLVLLPISASRADAVTVSSATYTDGAGGSQGIDVYSTGGSGKPGIIFVHGGGWRTGDKSQYASLGNAAAQRGYVATSIDYRLGSAGVYYQYEDVMRAVSYIRENAAKFGMNPNKIAIWGDSAGGSLAMRVAASGQSGLAAAVGWSAPVNAYTAIFNSVESFAIGADHSTCIPTDPTALASFLQNIPQSEGGTGSDTTGTTPTTSSLLNLLGTTTSQTTTGTPSTAAGGNTSVSSDTIVQGLNTLLSLVGGTSSSATTSNDTTSGNASTSSTTASTDATTSDTSNTNSTSSLSSLSTGLSQILSLASNAASGSSDTNVQNASNVLKFLSQSSANNSSTESIYDPKSSTATSEVKSAAAASSNASTATHTATSAIPAEAQRAILAVTDALGCQDNFRVMSPALNFASTTPPTFLVNAQSEYLVNPGQAIEYSNNLKAKGIDSSYLILSGSTHMGYDARAVAPSFAFLDQKLK